MFPIRSRKLISIITLITLTFACGPHKESPGLDPTPVASVDARGWKLESKNDLASGVRLDRLIMPPEEREFERHRARQTSMIPFPIDPSHNTSLYQIKNLDEWNQTLFIAPKIMAFSSLQGGRLSTRYDDHDFVSLTFPVAMIDGSQSKIDSPSGNQKTIDIPSQFLIHDLKELKEEAAKSLGFTPRISSLPGCPRRIIVRVSSNEYDATPSDLERADYCQPNIPFMATIRIPKSEARSLLEDELYKGAVEVRATYETLVPFKVSEARITFDKDKLFEALDAELKINGGFWFQSTLRTQVTKVVERQALKVSIQGEVAPDLQSVIDQSIKEFFIPFRPTEGAAAEKCSGSSVVCMSLNYAYSRESRNYSVSWNQNSNELTGQTYVTWARLAPLDQKNVQIGNSDGTAECSKSQSCRPDLKNDGNPIETGLTLAQGDLLEITPTYMIKEERSFNAPVYSRSDNTVCIKSVPHFEKVCEPMDHCHGRSCWYRELMKSASNCYQEQRGTECAQWENQWTDTWTYSYGPPQFKEFLAPNGQSPELYEGLKLRFTWNSQTGSLETMDCKLGAFQREGDGTSLLLRIENRPDCPIFERAKGSSPMLSILNQIHTRQNMREGREVRLYNGQILETPKDRVFDPQIRLGCSLLIRGYDFGVQSNGRL